MEKIFGIDPSAKFTAEEVRDAILECFYAAHKEIAEKEFIHAKQDFGEAAVQKLTRSFTEGIVQRAFSETGGDIHSPTKVSIQKAIDYLRDFSSDFRSKEIITKNYSDIKSLVEKLPEA